MTDIFFSYKREDEARAAPLARALSDAGFDVWWDRGLPGGESWRANIEAALHSAKCVVVVWSEHSIGPAGHFVRDEAGYAMSRGLLVPVMIDRVQPPLGFGELQAVDLSHWRGSARDPFFLDLVAAIRAKVTGAPAPKAKGPTARLARRLTWGGAWTAAIAIAASLAFNMFGLASQVCTAGAMQPGLSDGCGALGIGGRPARAERLVWMARRVGSCPDLRAYIDRYHAGGSFVAEANALLSARRVTRREVFTPGARSLVLYVPQSPAPLHDKLEAQAEAVVRAKDATDRLCRGFAATTLFRFQSARPTVQSWNCTTVAGGVLCGFDGQAVCKLEERHVVESETCGIPG